MNEFAVLCVDITSDTEMSLTLTVDEEQTTYRAERPGRDDVEAFARDRYHLWSTPPAGLAGLYRRLLTRLARLALPAALERRLRQWTSVQRSAHTLAVFSGDDDMVALPWELAPYWLQSASLRIVRLASASPATESAQTSAQRTRPPASGDETAVRSVRAMSWAGRSHPASRHDFGNLRDGRPASQGAHAPWRMLIAGWPCYRGQAQHGIAREMTELAAMMQDAGLTAELVAAPTVHQLEQAVGRFEPNVVHLLPATIEHAASHTAATEPRLTLPGEDGRDEWLDVGKLGDIMARKLSSRPDLVVINTSHSGLLMAGQLCKRLKTVTVGWPSLVSCEAKADFVMYFYRRLAEGNSVVEAVDAYLGHTSIGQHHLHRAVPVVWTPSRSQLSRSPVELDRERSQTTRTVRSKGLTDRTVEYSLSQERDVRIRIEFESTSAINPAMLSNGNPAISHLVVDSNRKIANLDLRIDCDTGSGISTIRQSVDLVRGRRPVPTEHVEFPALYQLIQSRAGRRQINFVATISDREGVLAAATRSVLLMGHNEWLDSSDVWQYIPAFVLPNSQEIRQVLDGVVDHLRRVGDASGQLPGYNGADETQVVSQMRAVYQVLCNEPYKLSYEADSSAILDPEESWRSMGQRVRLPGEIIEDRRGTCHDLSLFFASCAERIGLYPMLILKHGHTFFAYWKSRNAHRDFVNQRRSSPEPDPKPWVIENFDELDRFYRGKGFEVVEATEVCTADTNYEQARNEGNRLMRQLRANPGMFDAAVDVRTARHAIHPVHPS